MPLAACDDAGAERWAAASGGGRANGSRASALSRAQPPGAASRSWEEGSMEGARGLTAILAGGDARPVLLLLCLLHRGPAGRGAEPRGKREGRSERARGLAGVNAHWLAQTRGLAARDPVERSEGVGEAE